MSAPHASAAPPASAPLLEVEQLVATFALRRPLLDRVRRVPAPQVRALDGVSLTLAPHETLGVVGESGSGKSTLARVLVRLVRAQAGRVRLGGADVLAAGAAELLAIRKRMQLVYQDPYSSLNPRMTVGQAVGEAARCHGLVDADGARRRVAELLELVGLAPALGERRPRALSGGQRQRVAIARALAVEPELLIADEAVSALDVSVQAQILNLLSQLQAELGLGMIFISHQLSVVAHIADRVLVMYLGTIVESGTVADVFEAPQHPYTAGLLAAQPSLARRGRLQPPALRGEIPSPTALPSGCRFRTRCPLAEAICAEVDPPATEVAPGHVTRCHVMARVAGV